MEKSTNTDFRLNSICPHCNALVAVQVAIKTDYKEAEPEIETEGKDNGQNGNVGDKQGSVTESTDVRLVDATGKTGTTDSVPKSTDSGKSKTNNSTGGKTK